MAAHDWLYYLAPRNRAAVRQVKRAPKCTGFMTRLKADYLRLERPSFASCYRRCTAIARKSGLDWLPERTARRRLGEEVPRVSQVSPVTRLAGLSRRRQIGRCRRHRLPYATDRGAPPNWHR